MLFIASYRNTNSKKKSIYRFCSLLFVAIIMSYAVIVSSTNIIVDPMWLFSHQNTFNSKQLSFIEREQKTNFLTYRKNFYDALLIGNSRIMYINQNDFSGQSVYNYAASAMVANEYDGYISYAREISGNSIKTIYLGLSFASVNKEIPRLVNEKPPSYYTEKAKASLHRLRTVLTPSIFKFSLNNLEYNLFKNKKAHIIFDRTNVAYSNERDKTEHDKYFAKDLKEYKTVYTSTFMYDNEFKNQLRELVKKNSGVRFVVFTTPVSKQMHCLLKEIGLTQNYEQWIRDIVEVFGELHHFEYVHSIAEDHHKNFIDANHFLPKVGTMIAHHLQGKNSDLPSDFGIIINRDNLEQQLDFLRKNFDKCD